MHGLMIALSRAVDSYCVIAPNGAESMLSRLRYHHVPRLSNARLALFLMMESG